MTTFRKHLLIGLVALGVGGGSVAAYAVGPGYGPGPGPANGQGYGPGSGGDPAKFAERMKEHFDRRQAELHDKLKLTAAQEPAWNTFTQRMRPTVPPAFANRAALDKLPAPERMEKMLSFMKDREARMADHVVAVKEFYAVLTPEQKKVFDDQFAAGRRHRPGRW
ncbi:MAG TPA: Spy/CpxP family protein refolding chaperone [Noviherbaspirillum sp.]|nr:Spy/CpxP family protein refolding chaperone [Noviherbaspirillum sp.]